MAAPDKMYRFKDISTIPSAKDLIDIVLSQTQRRTPTVVHPQFKMSRIRSFYMRKIKFCQQTYHDKFTQILTEFPRLDDIHPFYADLCNVLYDRDHYKLALGQFNTVRGVIDRIAKDYVRLLKYADSPYKCKMLKRAALGRMCTAVRKLGDSSKYLEEVRQHLSRLPCLNPNTRTLILSGYPNVGKSSFMNAVSHANVEVQPYAFTTKSLFVGHFDFAYSRWQVIDTPGILDHPLANRNTIELTAITALAHIQAAVLFFVDISQQCGFSIENQVSLFHSIKVLFKNKPLVIVYNKVDVTRFCDLSPTHRELLETMVDGLEDVAVVETSCLASEGIDTAKNKACEMLLTRRVEAKINSRKDEAIANRLQVTNVVPPASRPPCIPASVLRRTEKRTAPLAREVEQQCGGPGVYCIDLQSDWKLKKEEWKYDILPEFYGGRNVLDFIDPDIDAKVRELELEEAQLLGEHEMNRVDDSEWQDVSTLLTDLHQKIERKRLENRLRTNLARTVTPRRSGTVSVRKAESSLKKVGYHIGSGLSPQLRKKHRRLTEMDGLSSDDSMDDHMGDEAQAAFGKKVRKLSLARSRATKEGVFADAVKRAKETALPNRVKTGLPSETLRGKAEKLKQRKSARISKTRASGESDRFIGTKRPKHLFSGKRGVGKHERR